MFPSFLFFYYEDNYGAKLSRKFDQSFKLFGAIF